MDKRKVNVVEVVNVVNQDQVVRLDIFFKITVDIIKIAEFKIQMF